MFRKLLFCSLLVCAAACTHAQTGYSNQWARGVMDMGTRCTTTNCFKGLPVTGLLQSKSYCSGGHCYTRYAYCNQATLDIGFDGYLACVGAINPQVYAYNQDTLKWSPVTAMGTSVYSLAIVSQNEIYSLQQSASCSSGYGVFSSTGGAWSQVSGCFLQMTVGVDGEIGGPGTDTRAFVSYDGGSTYQYLSSATGWNWIGMGSANEYCGINGSTLYLDNSGSGLAAFSPQPPVAPKECSISADGQSFIVVGTDSYLYSIDWASRTWGKAAGNAVSHTVTRDRGYTVTADTTAGSPIHYNRMASFVSMHTSGVYNVCPGYNTCPTNVTHTARAQITIPGGINGNLSTPAGLPTDHLDAYSWDATVQCDPFLGDLNDPSCFPYIWDNAVICSVAGNLFSGPTGGGAPPPIKPVPGVSYDSVSWDGTIISETDFPPVPPTDWWIVTMSCGHSVHSCLPPTVAFCDATKPNYVNIVGWWINSDFNIAHANALDQCAKGGLNYTNPRTGKPQPGAWRVFSVYDPDVGSSSCIAAMAGGHLTGPGLRCR